MFFSRYINYVTPYYTFYYYRVAYNITPTYENNGNWFYVSIKYSLHSYNLSVPNYVYLDKSKTNNLKLGSVSSIFSESNISRHLLVCLFTHFNPYVVHI